MLAVIVGRRRQGKSTLAYAIARSRRRSVIVFDPNDQFRALETLPDAAALPAWLETSGEASAARIVPAPPVEEAWAAAADILDGGRWAWGDYSLILDECSMLMSPAGVDERLERYARTAPADVGVFLTSHRPRDIAPLFRALATDWYVFQTTLDRDLEVLRANFGDTLADAVRTLPPYHCAHYWLQPGGEPAVTVWDRPEVWHIDIGRAT